MRYDYEDNPYNYPEKCGLEIVFEVDIGGSYEYDMLVVWKRKDNKSLWYATDSGCSCPSPFVDHGCEMYPITKGPSFVDFKDTLKGYYAVEKQERARRPRSHADYLEAVKLIEEELGS